MHIVQVEIDNFKSFSRKTKIPFFEGYTVISGPNGSGKSNIIDSVLFVLALSSSRNLRAEKLTDFINNVSGKNVAEVTLTFSDGTKIRRRIKQTSPTNYYSYYYLNEKTCSQTDIINHLEKSGIRPHGYNVVMQGDISRIMDMSDTERRKIIDEIAGVAEFDAKKDQALLELDQVRAKIEREESLLELYAQQLKDLASAKEDAEKYKKLNTELEYLNAAKQLANLKDYERDLSHLAESRNEQTDRRKQYEESISLEENERDARREEVAEIDAKIADKQGSGYLQLLEKQENEKGNIRVAEGTITRLKKDKESNLASMNTLYIEIQKNQNSFNEQNRIAQTMQIDRANLAMEFENQKKILEKAQELVNKKSKDSKGAQAELVELMRQLEAKKDERGNIVVQRDGIIEQSRVRQSQLEKYEGDQNYLVNERTETQGEISKLEGELADAKSEKSVFDKQIAESERKMMDSHKSLETVREEINRLSRRQMQLEAQQQASGASDRAITAVSGMDGVFGTVSNLGKVLDSQHTIALNIAAGGRLNNIIVDSDQTGANAIRYLKDEKLGRLTFLPLNKMKPQPPLPTLGGNGIIDYAINLIDFDEEYRGAFNLVFGQTVVVDTLDAGRRLMGKYRMVTLDGELLDKGGSMTGGSINKNIRGFGVAVGRESADLSAKIAELRADEEDLTAAEARYRSVAEGLRKERAEHDSAITQIELKIKECNRVMDKIAEDEVKLSTLLEDTQRDRTESSQKVADLETQVDAISDEMELINSKISELRLVVNEDEFNLLTEKYQRAQKDHADSQRRLDTKTNELNGVMLERNHFKKNVTEKTEERANYEKKNVDIDAEIVQLNAEIERANASIAAFNDELKSFTGELEDLKNERYKIQQSADEAQLKINSLQVEIERCNVLIASFDEKSKEISERIAEIRGSVEEDIECDLTMDEIIDGIITAERAIKRLGNVNMQAIDQYDDVLKKSEEKTEKKNTLSREREALLEKIESFKTMKHNAFMDSYTSIDKHFRDIYRRLNDGEGHLVLDNSEDPFLGGMTFEVSPKGKEVHRLNMMSGGEKSLTTLSFIFAIQQYMPAPFYALDEVDSNLDGVNVERLSNMVREICENSQFIIVSHRKPMIEASDRMVGVTVRASDKSTLVTGVKVND
ncbi:MAG: chromosome segregation protein SMC [Methanocorpusculum sp.]|nr:chromosome segregation protein SMC [Methanocorpusculum sp.]